MGNLRLSWANDARHRAEIVESIFTTLQRSVYVGAKILINSTMIASVNLEAPEKLGEKALQQFAVTTSVRRRGYDKLHLEDEA